MLVGIDLGTTNSLIACFRDGKAEIIPNRLGKYLTPSVISVDENGTMLVGETAREYGALHPFSMAKVFKRSMGTDRKFALGDHVMRAEELSGFLLRALKEDAEAYLGCEVDEAIISVPAYFNDFQRNATKRAGELAGLKVGRIINEPTAAAIAAGAGKEGVDETCLVFDLGGGTFDVSILDFSDNLIEVHAIAGDNFLGGEDFTDVLVTMFLQKSGLDISSLSIYDATKIFNAAEECKCSYVDTTEPVMSVTVGETLHEHVMPVTEFEENCESLLGRLSKPIERSLRDAGVRLDDIDRLVLVGGATRLPLIRKFVVRLFRHFPNYADDPDTAVAIGAAIECGMKERQKEIKEVVLTDVCPFTLGTEVSVHNGYFEEGNHYLPIIERNTTIPVSRTQTVYTAHDNQSEVRVKILQGESRIASNNLLLGEITVPVPPGPKGRESINITYTYDVNSILECEVCVNSTGLEKKAIVRNEDTDMTDEEIKEHFRQLEYLKQPPREEEKNKIVLLRGERLYEETFGLERMQIDVAMTEFNRALDRQDKAEISEARGKLVEVLDRIENR